MIEKAAWEAIGFDNGKFKIAGGNTYYESVMFNCSGRQEKVLLAKLKAEGNSLRQINRYVDADTLLEFEDKDWAEFCDWRGDGVDLTETYFVPWTDRIW